MKQHICIRLAENTALICQIYQKMRNRLAFHKGGIVPPGILQQRREHRVELIAPPDADLKNAGCAGWLMTVRVPTVSITVVCLDSRHPKMHSCVNRGDLRHQPMEGC